MKANGNLKKSTKPLVQISTYEVNARRGSVNSTADAREYKETTRVTISNENRRAKIPNSVPIRITYSINNFGSRKSSYER
jgi:hypothetical protein